MLLYCEKFCNNVILTGSVVYSWQEFSGSLRENNEDQLADYCKVEYFFYLTTISQENLRHFLEPIKDIGTIPFWWHYYWASFDLFSRNLCNWNYSIANFSPFIYSCSSLVSCFNLSTTLLIPFPKTTLSRNHFCIGYGLMRSFFLRLHLGRFLTVSRSHFTLCVEPGILL